MGEGIVLFLIGSTILLLIPSQIDSVSGMTIRVTPSFLPVVLGFSLMLVGLGLLIQSFRKKAEQQSRENAQVFSPNSFLRVFLAAVLLIVYTLLFPRFGFLVTSALFVGIFIYLFGYRSILKISLSMILVPVGVWIFFEKIFHIPLPHGLLF
ncbi:MAG TPA: tripartite tricarboxylate transporter TctB family protein [Spirochaetales bacterium]|nr:tripartite tricarboxylate transporter TctB family protein [Spirochaetales bacterium]